MTEKSFFAGFGGQGIISMGQVWIYCAMRAGKNVTYFPFYGAEKRGGIARASVIVSDDEIDSPLVVTPDSAAVMNADSLPLCEGILKENGLLLVNTSLVKQEPARTNLKLVKIEATGIAERLGNARFANIVAMGAMAKLTGVFSLDGIEEAFRDFFPASKQHFVLPNVEAVKAGFAAVS